MSDEEKSTEQVGSGLPAFCQRIAQLERCNRLNGVHDEGQPRELGPSYLSPKLVPRLLREALYYGLQFDRWPERSIADKRLGIFSTRIPSLGKP